MDLTEKTDTQWAIRWPAYKCSPELLEPFPCESDARNTAALYRPQAVVVRRTVTYGEWDVT